MNAKIRSAQNCQVSLQTFQAILPARDIHSRDTCYSRLMSGRAVGHSIDNGIKNLACWGVIHDGMVEAGKTLTTSGKVDTLLTITLAM